MSKLSELLNDPEAKAELARLIDAAAEQKAKEIAAEGKPVVCKRSKDHNGHKMIELSGPFYPIRLSANKFSRIIEHSAIIKPIVDATLSA